MEKLHLEQLKQLEQLFESMGVHLHYEGFFETPLKSEREDINYYINLLANKHDWKKDKMDGFLGKVYDINPGAAISIMLKEIAITLDKKYSDHIKNSPQIYAFSLASGKVIQLDKTNIKTFKAFAAFRSKEDVEFAVKILGGLIDEIF